MFYLVYGIFLVIFYGSYISYLFWHYHRENQKKKELNDTLRECKKLLEKIDRNQLRWFVTLALRGLAPSQEFQINCNAEICELQEVIIFV